MKKTKLPPLTPEQKDLLFAEMMQTKMKAIGSVGGANSRKNQPDGGTSLGRRAVEVRWARYHAREKAKDPKHVVPAKYRAVVAAILKDEKR